MARNLSIGHLNIYHLMNKVPQLSVFMTQPEPFHIFGVTESRLNPSISDYLLSVPGFSIMRRDPSLPLQTGVAAYVHDSVADITRRRQDLESDSVECLWLEVRAGKSAPLLIGFLYRNSDVTDEWYDDFVAMVDGAYRSSSDVILLGDFNIDMLEPHRDWDSTFTAVGLKQMVTSPTRVARSSATLIDHIYTSIKSRIIGVHVPQVAYSDHYPVCCSVALKVDSKKRQHQHTTIHTPARRCRSRAPPPGGVETYIRL